MKTDNVFFQKYSLTICAAISLLALFLPFISYEIDSSFVDDSQSFSLITGISEGGWLGIALIVCPILVILMNYVKQLEQYKGLIAIIAPALCIAGLIGDYFLLKSGIASASGSVDSMNSAFGTSVEMDMKIGIGFYLALIAYIAMLVCGAVLFHGLKLSKDGIKEFADNAISGIDSDKINELKDSGIQKLSQLKDTAATKVNSAVESVKEGAANFAENNAASVDSASSQPVKKKKSNAEIDNILSLIERLSEMKEKGILTEEEFNEKKKELLENI